MLLPKFVTPGETVSLKLVNGDELIARFESETTDDIRISRPLAINVSPEGLAMMPWVFLGDDEYATLKKAHVFVMMVSKKDAASQYLKNTSVIKQF